MAANFLNDLFQSIFTPGPTHTLLIATNVTFACLQVLLLLLLIATYSIHFVILSILSAGLWVAINWFANELKKDQLGNSINKSNEKEKE
ncbi:V-type ATPase assembly factor PKR1 [Golovinomyces cichoracearum]|uniref:V-type ATPase assembly factor PKR1 n=1 Tax=Golovinomyces cichoracearum TaxID=62708 RepID=A0A420IYG3_9PEZI|nr:V-type ATPase assembly factor PKR1 [Golovinomyces cichoracearum]